MKLRELGSIGRMIDVSLNGLGYTERTFVGRSGKEMVEFVFDPGEIVRMEGLTGKVTAEDAFTKMFGEDYGSYEALPEGYAIITVLKELSGFIQVPLKRNKFSKQGDEN